MPSLKTLIPMALLLAAASWIFLKAKKPKTIDENGEHKEFASRTESVSAATSAQPSASQNVSKVQAAKKRFGREIFAGIKRVPVIIEGDKLIFSLRPKTDGSACQIGDFDQIKSLAKSSEEEIFLMSVEAMEGSKGRSQAVALDLNAIARGKTVRITLPQKKGTQYFGVYLCSMGKSKNQCQDKPSMGPGDWQAASQGKRPLDKLIHFQMLAVKDSDVFLLPSSKWDKASLANVQKIVSGDDGKLDPAFERMRERLSQLGSLAATISGSHLELNLPYRGLHCN